MNKLCPKLVIFTRLYENVRSTKRKLLKVELRILTSSVFTLKTVGNLRCRNNKKTNAPNFTSGGYSQLRFNNVVYMKITSVENVSFSPSASEGATIEGPVFLEQDKNNCFYHFHQYHNNREGSGFFFSRGEFFRSVDAVTIEIVLSHTSMDLSESMELTLIITTTFGSGFCAFYSH